MASKAQVCGNRGMGSDKAMKLKTKYMISHFPRYARGRGQFQFAARWRAVCESAGLGRLRLHDLRHTYASHAVMSGENLPLVGRLLGHRRHRTTAGYAHLADGHLVEAADKVGKIIVEAMTNDQR